MAIFVIDSLRNRRSYLQTMPIIKKSQRGRLLGRPSTPKFDAWQKPFLTIYTTNAIESVNSVIRQFTRNRKIYPNEASSLKLIYMAIHEASKKWTMPIRHR